MRMLAIFLSVFVNLLAVEVEVFNVNIKNQGTVAKVFPGETFGVCAEYEFTDLVEKGEQLQLVLGIEGIGGQVCLANGLIGWDHKFYDHYSLYYCQEKVDITKKTVRIAMLAPQKPGRYEISIGKFFEKLPDQAIAQWAKTQSYKIGKIIVEESQTFVEK